MSLKSNPYLRTTKNDNEYHGFGILSIKDIVQKYDGLMDFYQGNQQEHLHF